jgi:integrase/recombinase XerD
MTGTLEPIDAAMRPARAPSPTASDGSDLLRQIAGAVDLLPALPPPDPDDRYHSRTLTAIWLGGLSGTSRRGYYQTLAAWLSWCEAHQLDPLRARKADTDAWKVAMTALKRGPDGAQIQVTPSRATIAKRLAVVSSWYTYLIANELDVRNPAAGTERPRVAKQSMTASLDIEEMVTFLDWLVVRAERLGTETSWRDAALLTVLFSVGLRVTSGATVRLEDLRHTGGYTVLRYRRKSRGDADDWGQEPLPPHVLGVLDRYLLLRAERETRERGHRVGVDELTGYLFVSTPHPHLPQYVGGQPLGQNDVDAKMRNLARQCGLAGWRTLSPHSARHTAGTVALTAGATLKQVQDMLDHANPATTQLYVHRQDRLQNSAVWKVAEAVEQERRRRVPR